MRVTLSVDGVTAAQWMPTLITLLEYPAKILA